MKSFFNKLTWFKKKPLNQFSSTLLKCKQIKPYLFESIYYSRYGATSLTVLYPTVGDYIHNVEVAIHCINEKVPMPVYLLTNPVKFVYVDEFFMTPDKRMTDSNRLGKKLIESIVTFITIYERKLNETHVDDLTTERNLQVMSVLVSNIHLIVNELHEMGS